MMTWEQIDNLAAMRRASDSASGSFQGHMAFIARLQQDGGVVTEDIKKRAIGLKRVAEHMADEMAKAIKDIKL